MTWIKICGVTRGKDALLAASLGVDAIGFVMAPRSPRRVRPREARAIARDLAVMTVAVFEDAPLDDARRALEESELRVAQLHGREPAAYCDALGVPYIKAFRARPAWASRAIAYIGDGADTWGAIPSPRVLAGGLTPENVRAALRERPFGVDVARGVEHLPGIKDEERMRRFVAAVRET